MGTRHRTDRPEGVGLRLHRPEQVYDLEPEGGPDRELRLRMPPKTVPGLSDVVYWRVNGYRAAMMVWTDVEFERLPAWERPIDAQRLSCGIWAVLRMV